MKLFVRPYTIVLLLCLASLLHAANIFNLDFEDGMPNELSLDEDGLRCVFHFIVVGSGASGSVVASRLARETNKRVLLLEGGARGTGQRDIGGIDYVASDFVTNPVTGKQTLAEPLTRYDVILMADSIRGASNVLNNTWPITPVGPFFSQAKVIGGNQATSGGAWYVPQWIDFDSWGIPGYTGADMKAYYKRIENATEIGFGGATRGTSGPINVRFPSFYPLELFTFINASKQAGYTMGGDINTGNVTNGIYQGQQSSKNGIREASAVGYLAKALNRPNLDFRTSTVVTKVLFNIFNRAIGVEYVNKQGRTRRAYALGEVILSAGTLQDTKILYNSGIGPKSVLQAFGKPLRVVNNIIGQRIRNHQRASFTYNDPTLLNANFYSLSSASLEYARTGTGMIDRASIVVQTQVDSTSPYPDITINAGGLAGATPTDSYAQRITITATLTANKYANGTLNLTSSDPLGPTIYTANAFVVDEDVIKVAKGLLEARRIMSYWNGATEISPGPEYDTVEELIPWIRDHPLTNCHYYGSVPMGIDPSAPCDTRMRVRGVRRLRIVSPSVIPGRIYWGMQSTATVFGEKGTDLIKEDYGL